MKHERIYLDKEKREVFIDTYISENNMTAHPAMLVIPGGGYRMICSDREGEPIALAYLARGFNAFVLSYQVDEKYPASLIDAARAVLYLKTHSDELCIDPSEIYAVGFSAGGHLAGSLAVMHSRPELLDALGCKAGDCRPCGVVLSYPVVSAMTDTHKGSFEMLSGLRFDDIPQAMRRSLSLEENVTLDASPAFIWHTYEDKTVPAYGSLMLAEAYLRAGVPATLHMYPYGCHGVALANEVTANAPDTLQPLAEGWVDYSCKWILSLKNKKKDI